MAAQNGKKVSRSSRGTTTRGGSSGKKNTRNNKQKGNQGPDLLTIIVVLVAVVLVLVLVSKNKKNDGEGPVLPTKEVSPTEAIVPDMATPEPETNTPVPTKETEPTPTKDVKPTVPPTATPVPTPTEEPVLSLEEAKKIAERIVTLDRYSMELLDDHLMIDGCEYYAFCINDAAGESMEPLLIVERKEGTLLCYDTSGVVATIETFPLDQTETGNEDAAPVEAEAAKKVLLGYSAKQLGIAKDPASYDMTIDEWTTNVEGIECYGVNLLETVNGTSKFRGTFYVTMDGSAVYSRDDATGEFIKR
ncbi:MAG: hypothetical protein IKB07_08505 [Lachnospiraceae bacterium]|nr:hypothetical protein [Lachnospiraceae bacterium]